MLTEKQRNLLVFIHERTSTDGVSPSFDEMKDALGLASKSGIHRLITALVERGFLRRLPNRARALEVLRLPDEQATPPSAVAAPVASNDTDDSGMDMPLLGKIAAGVPISAIQHEVDRVVMPSHLIGRGEHFALEVEGDSMIEAGILDGDIVLIRKAQTALAGDVVVALVDEEEATLKTFRKQGRDIVLEPANADYEPRKLPAERVQVQGKLVGLVRRYH